MLNTNRRGRPGRRGNKVHRCTFSETSAEFVTSAAKTPLREIRPVCYFCFPYVNKLAIDSVHDAEADSKRLPATRFVLLGNGGVKSALFYLDLITRLSFRLRQAGYGLVTRGNAAVTVRRRVFAASNRHRETLLFPNRTKRTIFSITAR